jgi:putative Mn2+ efflux pump MntP
MEHVLSAVLLATCSNIDNLGVGVAYGVGGRTIRLPANLLIALVSGGGTLVSLAAGEWVNDFMSEEVANVLGSGIMMLIGIITLVRAIRGADDRPLDGGPASSAVGSAPNVGAREATALAVSLTLNNLGLGLGAGISHVSLPLATGLTMVVSVAAMVGGHLVGRRASLTISKRWLGVASGVLMIAVGTYEYFV